MKTQRWLWLITSVVLLALPIVVVITVPSIMTEWVDGWKYDVSCLFDNGLWPFNEYKGILLIASSFLAIGCILLIIPFVSIIESTRSFRGWGVFFLVIGALPFVFSLLNIIITGIQPVLAVVGILLYLVITIIAFVLSIKEFRKPLEEEVAAIPKWGMDKIVIEDGLNESQEKAAAQCLANDLKNRCELVGFSSLLSEDVTLKIYDEKKIDKISGKQQVVQYWNNWIEEQNAQGAFHQYTIKKSKYFSAEVLQIEFWLGTFFVVFSFNHQGKIQHIIFTNEDNCNTDKYQSPINSLDNNQANDPNPQSLEFWDNN